MAENAFKDVVDYIEESTAIEFMSSLEIHDCMDRLCDKINSLESENNRHKSLYDELSRRISKLHSYALNFTSLLRRRRRNLPDPETIGRKLKAIAYGNFK